MTPIMTPRLMTKGQAAAYCAMSPSRFGQLVKTGTLPSAVIGTTRWDRAAIDAALDRLAGLRTTAANTSPLDKWLAKHDPRAA